MQVSPPQTFQMSLLFKGFCIKVYAAQKFLPYCLKIKLQILCTFTLSFQDDVYRLTKKKNYCQTILFNVKSQVISRTQTMSLSSGNLNLFFLIHFCSIFIFK